MDDLLRDRVEVDAEPDTPLLWARRDLAGLTGTKYGCGAALCGACTVHVDGKRVLSCMSFAVMNEGHEIATIESLASPTGDLHPMQQAFVDNDAFQCGYCTPGLLLAAIALLSRHPNPSDAEIRRAIAGNTCRCTGYQNILKAIRAAAKAHDVR